MNLITQQAFVKNPSTTCCVAYKDVVEENEQDAGIFVALVKAIAITANDGSQGFATNPCSTADSRFK
jgi:hypothetical protein